ncbi:MAG TPA: hypothetical protein VGH40_04820 [Roseiarcus sp.]
MEEFTEEFAALEARRNAALEKLRAATDPDEIKRLQDELLQIEAAITALGDEEAY